MPANITRYSVKKIAIYSVLIVTLFLSLNVSVFFENQTPALSLSFGAQQAEAQVVGIVKSGICITFPRLCPAVEIVTSGGQVVVDQALEKVEDAAMGALTGIIDPLLRGLANALMWIASWFTWLAGAFLNMVILITVVNMSQLVDAMPVINDAWGIFRDLANIVFIFILLYIAVATILELNLNTGKTLTRVIIAALLINFSLFFTNIIVDTSNILTLNLYNQIAEQAPSGTITDIDNGLSGVLYEKLKLTTLYDVEGAKNSSDAAGKTVESFSIASGGNIFAYLPRVIGGVIILMTAALVLFIAAFLFLTRFVVIIFLMITAPIAFVAMILPQTAGTSKKWWAALSDQAVFAPVFMLLMIITIEVADSLNKGINLVLVNVGEGVTGGLASALFSGSATQTASLVSIFIVFAFLIGTLVISKKAGAAGGDWATKAGTAAVFGGAAFAGRQTAGRLGGGLARSKTLGDIVEKNKGKKGPGAFLARTSAQFGRNAGAVVATSSFDARNTKTAKGAGGLASAISQGLGGGKTDLVGKGTKDGGLVQQRQKRQEEANKRTKERIKAFETKPEEFLEAEQQKARADAQHTQAVQEAESSQVVQDLQTEAQEKAQQAADLKSEAYDLEQETLDTQETKDMKTKINQKETQIESLKENIQNQRAQINNIQSPEKKVQAIQALTNEENTLQRLEREAANAEKELQNTPDQKGQQRLDAVKQKRADADQLLKDARGKLQESKNTVEQNTRTSAEVREKASSRLDELKGVDLEEAKKRARNTYAQLPNENKKVYDERIESLAKTKFLQESIEKKRKQRYAEEVGNRNVFQRAIRLQTKSDVAAQKSAIEKDLKGKSVKDMVDEVMKKSGEIKDEDTTDTTTTPTPADPTTTSST